MNDRPTWLSSPTWQRVFSLHPLVYLTALVVAAFAFIVSYSHIYDLGREHAQAGTAARLLPLSVDLLIVAASLVLFIQSSGDTPEGLARWLPRAVLWAGIGATVAANVAYGLPHGWLAAVISGWPGAAFVAMVEMVIVTARTKPGKPRQRVTPAVTAWKPDAIRKIAADEGCAPKTAQLVQRRERAAVKAAFNGHGDA